MSRLAASYGDVTGEYLALRRAAGLVAGAHELVWVTGPDAVRFLDGLLSQEVASIDPGTVARSLLLAPQGKLRATLWVLAAADRIGLVADAGFGDVVVADLARFKIRVDVAIEPDRRPLWEVWGPDAGDVVAAIGSRPAPGAAEWFEEQGMVVAAVPFQHVSLSRFMIVGAEAETAVAAGAVRCGALAVDTVRIEAGEAVMGRDLDHGTIPQEGDVVAGAVSFTKGCYLGQELVARIDSRGRVNRHLRGLVIRANIRPPEGATVTSGGVEVGTVTSVGESLELRAPVGMALLRREVEPGTEVDLTWEKGSVAAGVSELPLDDFALP